MEIWKSIKGYEGLYEVSNLGNVRSVDRTVNTALNHGTRIVKGKIIKPILTNKGYFQVCLSKECKLKYASIHRLVAEAFIDNPENLPVVNHKDGNKLNNRVDNLEWCTYQYNHWHARENGLLVNMGRYQCTKYIQCVETGMIFEAGVDAARWLSENENLTDTQIRIRAQNILRCAKGGTPRAYKYHWQYVEKGSTTSRKAYTQASGNGRPLTHNGEGEDIVSST